MSLKKDRQALVPSAENRETGTKREGIGGRKAVRTTLGYTTVVTRCGVLIISRYKWETWSKRLREKHESLILKDLRCRHTGRERQFHPGGDGCE
jgi:hypothetical protein